MSFEKEIQALHNKGFVILSASRSTNAPIGWKRKTGNRWGYTEEMNDPALTVYKETFKPSLLAKSHCGFYLGHGNLCCIDLDTKKTTIEQTTELKDLIIKQLGDRVVVERTKSNGFHIYFLYPKRLDNVPDYTGKGKSNWIEVYYSKRFIAAYISNSRKYKLEHGSLLDLKAMSSKEHARILHILSPFGAKPGKLKKTKSKAPDTNQELLDEAENFVKQIESQGLDITGDNPKWFKIGKAFANAFGINGFDMFNRLSQYSPTYNADTIYDTYIRFVEDDGKDRGKKITIATFFKFCLDQGLTDLSTARVLKLQPASVEKEFDIYVSKKDKQAVQCHAVIIEFVKHIQICCLDEKSFYIFEHTHWIRCNARRIIELIHNFISRSTIDPKLIEAFHTVPYMELMLKELRIITQRDALEPRTGSLSEGIFVNVENGILHVNTSTGKCKLLDHAPEYNFTTILPYCYDRAAQCPKFDAWLDKQIPDKELHVAYYAFVASCLTKHKADIIMLLAGETSTGKSSLIDITRRVIGLENSVAISASTLFGGSGEAAAVAMQMENKLLAYDFDSEPFKHLEMLLKVAAQEPIMGWQMHVARRPVVNYGRLIIAMNPYNYSVFNAAVARRFITVNMDVPVVKDNTVMPAIYENELAGIFNKVIEVGLKHLIQNGGQIKKTERMEQTTRDFHTRSKDVTRFLTEYKSYVVLKQSNDTSTKYSIEEKLKRANVGKQIITTSITELYQEFRVWAEDVEYIPIGKILQRKHFIKDLESIGIKEAVYRLNNELKRVIFIGK